MTAIILNIVLGIVSFVIYSVIVLFLDTMHDERPIWITFLEIPINLVGLLYTIPKMVVEKFQNLDELLIEKNEE